MHSGTSDKMNILDLLVNMLKAPEIVSLKSRERMGLTRFFLCIFKSKNMYKLCFGKMLEGTILIAFHGIGELEAQ